MRIKIKNNLAKNYIYNLLYQIVIMVAPLIITPYLSRVLGAEKIGIYSYTLSISAYFILFGALGTAMYGQREVAFYRDNKDKLSKIFFEILILRILTLTISLIIFYFTFCSSKDYGFYYKILVLDIIAAYFDINWFFQGIEEFKSKLIRSLLVKTISIACIFLLVKNENDLWLYFLIYVISNCIGNLSMWTYLPKYIQKINFKSLNILSHFKPTLELFIPQIAIQIYTVLDKTMIGMIVMDKSEVGYYEQAQKVIKLLIMLSTSLGTVLSPRIANIYMKKDMKVIDRYMNKSLSIILMLSFPLMFGIICLADSFVPLFYGPGFSKVSDLMIILSPIVLMIGLSNWIGIQYLLPTKQQKKYTISVVLGAIINFTLNILLIKKYMSIGASLATLVAEFSVTAIQIYLVRDTINFKDILRKSYKYLLASILSFFICILLKIIINNSILQVFCIVVAYIVTYIIFLYWLKEECCLNIIKKIRK